MRPGCFTLCLRRPAALQVKAKELIDLADRYKTKLSSGVGVSKDEQETMAVGLGKTEE